MKKKCSRDEELRSEIIRAFGDRPNDPKWSPLGNWNDTMDVVRFMRANGFFLDINSGYLSVECGFVKGDGHWSVRCEPGNEQRAILKAAVKAIKSKDWRK